MIYNYGSEITRFLIEKLSYLLLCCEIIGYEKIIKCSMKLQNKMFRFLGGTTVSNFQVLMYESLEGVPLLVPFPLPTSISLLTLFPLILFFLYLLFLLLFFLLLIFFLLLLFIMIVFCFVLRFLEFPEKQYLQCLLNFL